MNDELTDFLAWLRQRKDGPLDRFGVSRLLNSGAMIPATDDELTTLVAAFRKDRFTGQALACAYLDVVDSWLEPPATERDEDGRAWHVDCGHEVSVLDLVVTWRVGHEDTFAERHRLGEFAVSMDERDRVELDWLHPEVSAALERVDLGGGLSGLDVFTMPGVIAA